MVFAPSVQPFLRNVGLREKRSDNPSDMKCSEYQLRPLDTPSSALVQLIKSHHALFSDIYGHPPIFIKRGIKYMLSVPNLLNNLSYIQGEVQMDVQRMLETGLEPGFSAWASVCLLLTKAFKQIIGKSILLGCLIAIQGLVWRTVLIK